MVSKLALALLAAATVSVVVEARVFHDGGWSQTAAGARSMLAGTGSCLLCISTRFCTSSTRRA